MKYSSRVLIITTLLLFTCACVDLQVETNFKSDGSGVQIWHFTSSALMANQIKKYVDSHPLLRNGKKILDEFKKGEYWLALEISFSKVNELQDDSREIRFQKKGLFRRTYTYSEFWKKQLGSTAGPIAEQAGQILPVKVKWQIRMPGTIEESNADEVSDGVAVWNLTLTDFAAQHSFSARSTSWNIPLLIGLAVAIAGAFAGIWFGVKRYGFKSIKCAACGVLISADSLYCNRCGKSQRQTE